MHKKLAVLAVVLVFAVPSAATAASLTADQINAILSLLQSFGADPTTVQNVNAALTGGVVLSPTQPCLVLSRDLTIGSAGSDVTSLQNYLISRGYLAAGYNTGYYGYLTAEAVGKLQLALGDVGVTSAASPGYGMVGVLTREALQYGCAPAQPLPYANFTAHPASGTAPLYVEFKLSNYMDGSLQIDFGDGVVQNTDDSCLMGAACKEPYIRSHTYSSPGTYTARLLANGVAARIVYVTVTSAAQSSSIRVTSPNGGESVDPNQDWKVKAYISNLKTLSFALYKNGTLYSWLMKDISTAGQPTSFEWIHSHTPMAQIDPGLVNGSTAIYKIYASGLKADGTGYVEDFSDAPFSFSGNGSCVSPKITQPAAGYSIALSPGQNGTGQIFTADQSVTYSLTGSPSWATFSGNKLTFNAVPTTTGTYYFTVVATAACGATSTFVLPVIVSNGTASIDANTLTSYYANPTLSGNANVSAVGFSIGNGDKVYGSGVIGVSAGRWSHYITTPLRSGTYTVTVYNYYSNVELARGTLTVL